METVEVLDLQNLAHKILAITVNCEGGATQERYEATRAFWKLSPARANEAEYILSVTRGIVKAIYQVNSNGWQVSTEHEGRYYFDGNEITDPAIASLYLGKMIERKKGQANPIQYLYGVNTAQEEKEISIPADAVVISPKNETEIAWGEFRGNETLTSIIIPNTVIKINSYAFAECTSLQSVVIPNSVTKIGENAFYDCTSLESVIFNPSSKKLDIERSAFLKCDSLIQTNKSFIRKLFSYAYYIDNYGVFYSLDKKSLIDGKQIAEDIMEFVVPEGVECIEENAFSDSEIKKLIIPNSVTTICNNAFESASIKEIVLPSNIKEISDGVFNCCAFLKSIIIPDSVTKIGNEAFLGCGLLESISIPNSVITIGNGVFNDCEALRSVNIPETTTAIGTNLFIGCDNLENLIVPNKANFVLKDGVIYSKDMTQIIFALPDIETVTIPDTITNISEEAFHWCSSLTEVSLPESITNIGARAFANCSSLSQIKIPHAVAEIPAEAFHECSSLTEISLPEGITKIGARAFANCASLAQIKIPHAVTEIPEGAFYECSSLTEISLPEGITKIGREAFQYCMSLPQIKLPHTIEEIEYAAFFDCKSLKFVEFNPESAVPTDEEAFSECTELDPDCKEHLKKVLRGYNIFGNGEDDEDGWFEDDEDDDEDEGITVTFKITF